MLPGIIVPARKSAKCQFWSNRAFDFGLAGMDRGEIDAQVPAARRLPALTTVQSEDGEAVEHLVERAAHLHEIRRGVAFWAHMPRYGRSAADLFPELLAVLGDREPSVPRGIALPFEQLYRPRARQVGGAAAGRVDNRLHGHSRFPEIIQIRQVVYPATAKKMRSARKNLPFSTGYGEMGPPCAQPFHGAPSIVPTDCRQSSRRIIVNRHNVARSTRTGDC